jgi:hypothetical protein
LWDRQECLPHATDPPAKANPEEHDNNSGPVIKHFLGKIERNAAIDSDSTRFFHARLKIGLFRRDAAVIPGDLLADFRARSEHFSDLG